MEVRHPHAAVASPVTEWRQTPDGEWRARITVPTKSNAQGPYDTLTLRWTAAVSQRPLT